MTLRLRKGVSIEPVLPKHAAEMYRWMCDDVISDNLGLRGEPSLERTARWIENASSDNSIGAFAILFDGRHVGNVVIDRIDFYLREGRLSVYVGDEQGRGLGLTGMYLTIQYAFQVLDLLKIYLTVHVRNFRAIAAYSQLGFILEGVLRDAFILRGERFAAFYMGLICGDFERLETEWLGGTT